MTTAEASSAIAPELRRSAGWVIALGVLQILVGIVAIGSPLITGVAVTYFVGAALVVAGVFRIVYATRAGSWGAGLLAIVGGLLAILAGATVIAHPVFGLKFLTLLLIIYFVMDGVARSVLALQMRPSPGWGWQLFTGVVTLLLALVIWRQWPVSGAWAIGILVGIEILLVGWTHVALGLAAKAVTAPEATGGVAA